MLSFSQSRRKSFLMGTKISNYFETSKKIVCFSFTFIAASVAMGILPHQYCKAAAGNINLC
jgi:hypothetical protein